MLFYLVTGKKIYNMFLLEKPFEKVSIQVLKMNKRI